MPFYSPNSEYGFEKFRINPKNRGRWDGKNTGEYYSGIKAKIFSNRVEFIQKIKKQKISDFEQKLENANRNPLGVTKEQIEEVQLKNAPGIKKRIENILNNG